MWLKLNQRDKLYHQRHQNVKQNHTFTNVKPHAVNQAKWKAAKEFCDDRRIEFKIVTKKN